MTKPLAKNYLIELQKAQTSNQMSMALEQFYNDTSHLVFNYCRKKGLAHQDTEDITQIVYTQIFNKRAQYNPIYSPLAWLFIIAKSETKDYLKKQAIYANYLSDFVLFLNMSQNGVENPIPVLEGTATSMLDLSKLSKNEKLVIEERYYNEKDFHEIAKSLGFTEVNVRQMISRAIKKLKA